MRKIIIGVMFLFFITSTLVSAYTLPFETDMFVFLPDSVGEYRANDPYDMEMFLDNPNTNPLYNNTRSVFRTYVNNEKIISASIIASNLIVEDETTGDEDIDCDYHYEDINIQGFDGYTIEIVCRDGSKTNTISVNFIIEDDFIYSLFVSSSSQLNNTGGLGGNGELVSLDELYNFTNMLDLKGMSLLVK